jgi:hypothetical protein
MVDNESGGLERYDDEERWRCPMLGGPVTFVYCRKMNDGLPCARVLECWLPKLPLVEFLKTNYSPEQLERVFATKTKGRIARMVEAVEQARQDEPPATAQPDTQAD